MEANGARIQWGDLSNASALTALFLRGIIKSPLPDLFRVKRGRGQRRNRRRKNGSNPKVLLGRVYPGVGLTAPQGTGRGALP